MCEVTPSTSHRILESSSTSSQPQGQLVNGPPLLSHNPIVSFPPEIYENPNSSKEADGNSKLNLVLNEVQAIKEQSAREFI